MVNIRPNINDAERYVRPPQFGFFFFQQEQESGSLLQLVPGYQGRKDQLAVEGQMGTTDSITNCSSMEVSNMLPRLD
ncbi:hypothetical protein AYI69_g2178 [Smittium culicis]|uniref:Uncharacterized protein n=1 Tax=Smittium culicis TaxID=133412 RepID=A0A1R1YN73_9FUNG|nr:hypothetical protein AYI69_g2178 [Smittium culicis]